METASTIQQLAERLRHPDPRVRVETLRILAMVEETQALQAVEWMAANDPESGVRDVARWAGDILRQAHARGHSTRGAIDALYEQCASEDREAAFLAELEPDLSWVGKHKGEHYAIEQSYRRQLSDLLRAPRVEPELAEEAEVPSLPAPPAEDGLSIDGPDDFSDLLDAGLTFLKVNDDHAG